MQSVEAVKLSTSANFKSGAAPFSLIYFPTHDIIVAGLRNGRIQGWIIGSQKKIFDRSVHKSEDVNHLMVWDEKSGIFLSCSDDYQLLCLSIFSDALREKFELKAKESSVMRLLRVSKDRFIFLQWTCNVKLVSYSLRSEIRDLKSISVGYYSKIVLSCSYENCVYINTKGTGTNAKIFRLNYETNELVSCYDDHGYKTHSLEVHRDTKICENEMVVCGGSCDEVIFYDSKTEKIVRRISVGFSRKLQNECYYMLNLNQDYILTGGGNGRFELLNLKSEEINLGMNFKEKKTLYQIIPIKILDSRRFHVAVCFGESSVGWVRILELENLKLNLVSSIAEMDMKERIEFLKDETNDYGTAKVFSIHMKNLSIENLLKVLFVGF